MHQSNQNVSCCVSLSLVFDTKDYKNWDPFHQLWALGWLIPISKNYRLHLYIKVAYYRELIRHYRCYWTLNLIFVSWSFLRQNRPDIQVSTNVFHSIIFNLVTLSKALEKNWLTYVSTLKQQTWRLDRSTLNLSVGSRVWKKKRWEGRGYYSLQTFSMVGGAGQV